MLAPKPAAAGKTEVEYATIAGGHHVAFTVRDADRSAQWYEDLLGMQVVLRGAVSSRAELEDWEQRLRESGVNFTPVAETPIGSVIVFRDPDNIQLEFWLPAGR